MDVVVVVSLDPSAPYDVDVVVLEDRRRESVPANPDPDSCTGVRDLKAKKIFERFLKQLPT